MPESPQMDINRVAELARIALSEKEKERLSTQLNSILGYVNKLNELNTDDVEPMAHPHSVENVWREDRVEEGLSIDEALQNAPKSRQNMFVVPKVVE